jgi:glycosyltransferase involved in cell wall biosynthesis
LFDGVNGHLAEGKSLDASALAKAVVKCLHDRAAYARLRRGAHGTTKKFTLEVHLHALMDVLKRVSGGAENYRGAR